MRSLAVLALVSAVVGSGFSFAASTSDSSSAAVERVLRREIAEDVEDRSILLRDILKENEHDSAARWAMGEVHSTKTWQPFSVQPEAAAENELLAAYRDRRGVEPLSVEGHRELAGWCRDQGLTDQERAHLQQMLLADPSQTALWKRLDYRQVDGHWLSPEQMAAVESAAETYRQQSRQWQARAQAIAERLSSPQPGTQAAARESLKRIADPAAIPALELALTAESAELSREFIAWVRQFQELPATFALTRQSVLSPWSDVRELAIDGLRNRRRELFIPALLDSLSGDEEWQVVYNTKARVRVGDPLIVAMFRRELRETISVQKQTVVMGRPLSTVVARPRDPRIFGRQFARLNAERNTIADQLRAADQQESIEAQLAGSNSNTAVEAALRGVTGVPGVVGAKEWWSWWASVTDTTVADTKSKLIVEVEETTTLRPAVALRFSSSCLPAGTLTYTELGPKPIETIRIGDKVLSKDVETGELAYRVVLQTTVRRPQPLVKLSTATETIESTRGHHFWVSGKGWRMAREIQPGDRLHGVKGTVRITDVSTGDMAEVYNLVVDRANTYFVGESLVLSHDVTFPSPTNVKVPGLAAK